MPQRVQLYREWVRRHYRDELLTLPLLCQRYHNMVQEAEDMARDLQVCAYDPHSLPWSTMVHIYP